MVVRDGRWPPGAPSWVDLVTPDRDAAASFYSEVLGWQVDPPGTGTGYVTARRHGRTVAGLVGRQPGSDLPPAWTTYLATDDAAATCEAAEAAGGGVLIPAMPVGPAGTMALVQDPAGAVIGLWQPAGHPGADLVDEPGAVVWNECLSRDAAAARAFYTAVFGYTYEPMEGAEDYTAALLPGSGERVGGIGQLPADVAGDVPSHWMVYFGVADADRATSTATARGGTVLAGPFDTPYGRTAIVQDPQGGVFSVIQVTGPA